MSVPFFVLPKLRTPKDAKLQSLKLYKKCMRTVPSAVKLYGLPKTTEHLKHLIRSDFRNKSSVVRMDQIESLLIKGYQDLEEITEGWKTKFHAEYFFQEMEENLKLLSDKSALFVIDDNTPKEIVAEYVGYFSDKPAEEGLLDRLEQMPIEEIEQRIQALFESRQDPILNTFMDGHADPLNPNNC